MEKLEKISRLTGIKYNVFTSVSILNIAQVMAYLDNGAIPLDIYVSRNRDGNPCLVFVFDRNSTQNLYDLWCKHELIIKDNRDEN